MSIFSKIAQFCYTTYRQYLYTAAALATIVWKRISEGDAFLRIYEYPEPDCVGDRWNHKYVQLKEIRMHYVEEGVENDKVLLMVHGFPEFWYSWRYQLDHFKGQYRCIAIDMRGYNLTDKPSGVSSYSMTKLVDDIRQFIEILDLKNVTLAAHDWGAIISWRFAQLHPSMIQKLIICNVPHPKAFETIYRTSAEQRSKSWYIYLFQSNGIPEILMRANKMEMLEKMFRGKKAGIRRLQNFSDEDMLAWKHVFSQPGGTTGPLNYYRALFDAAPVPREKHIVQVPVLIIWGEDDAFLDKRGASESAKHCQTCRVHMIPKASHWVQQDQPEMVNQIMEMFTNEDFENQKLEITKNIADFKSKI